nr:CPBP family intramembrane metalloprotease [Oscillospiraceae bacterium]
MTDKQINKWLRRQFSPLGWSLAGYHVLINLLAIVAMIGEAAKQMLSASDLDMYRDQVDLDAIAGNAWGYVAAVLISFVILYAAKGSGYWKEIRKKEKSMVPGVFFSLLCLSIGAQMVNSFWVAGLELLFNQFDKSFETLLESVSGDSDTFSMFLYMAVLAPIGEEVLFRGYALRSLQPYGKRFAVLGSAFLFGIFHGNLLQIPYAFLMGLILGYVTVEYSMVWAVALHMFNNLVLADLLTRLTNLLPPMLADAVTLLLLGSCMIVSGILLFVKRREIINHISSEWMDRRVLKCFFTNAGILILTALMLLSCLMFLP